MFLGTLLRLLGLGGKLLTYDFFTVQRRGCNELSGVKSQLWASLVRDGIVEPRVADITQPAEVAYVHELARGRRGAVLFIDDGDHFATPLIVHFMLFGHLVTPGSYYLIQDTRLDRTCYAQKHLNHLRGTPQATWQYCVDILGTEGGPARAVRYLECRSPRFRAAFEVDRSREEWVFTQHPRGYLLRKPGSLELGAALK